MVASYPKPARPDRPEWIRAKSVGDAAERLVADFFRQLGLAVDQQVGRADHDLEVVGKVDVKHDEMAMTTGRVAIETTHRGSANGLMTTGAGSWAILVGGERFFNPVPRVRQLVAGLADVPAGESAIVRLLPLATLRQHARRFVLGGGQ